MEAGVGVRVGWVGVGGRVGVGGERRWIDWIDETLIKQVYVISVIF